MGNGDHNGVATGTLSDTQTAPPCGGLPAAESGVIRGICAAREPAEVLSSAIELLGPAGAQHVLLRYRAESGWVWTSTLPDPAWQGACAEHLALVAYGRELNSAEALHLEWVEDVHQEAQYLPSVPFAEALGFRTLVFCPVPVGDSRGRCTTQLVGWCWRNHYPRTPEAQEWLCALAAVVATVYVARRHDRLLEKIETTPSLHPVTQLPSPDLMERLAPRLVAAADRRQEPLAFLVVRPGGETWSRGPDGPAPRGWLLQAVGSALAGSTRASDLVGHRTDQEFAVLLPGADVQAAVQVAYRLVSGVSNACGGGDGATAGRRATIGGMARAGNSSLGYHALVRVAEAAATQAERQGQAVLLADEATGGFATV